MTHNSRLGDYISVKHGFAFKGEFFDEPGDLLVVTPGNFHEEGGFKLRPGKDRFYKAPFPEEFLLSKGDIIVAMTEQAEGLLGSSAFIPADNGFLHNQRLGLVQFIGDKVADPAFFYYLFNSPGVRAQIRATATGAKVKHTAPKRIEAVTARIPDLIEQQEIGGLLLSHDKTIENNTRRIALLEEAARLIFKEWFVYLRFPDHEKVKVVDGVPEGWQRTKIGFLLNLALWQSSQG
jgi:type I restriction enzyme, S subunit